MNKQNNRMTQPQVENARRSSEKRLTRWLRIVCTALILALMVGFVGLSAPAFAQGENPPATGPTSSDCFSASFHAASDCDRLASTLVTIPVTGAMLLGPTLQDCYTTRFHAATDCDRLRSLAIEAKASR